MAQPLRPLQKTTHRLRVSYNTLAPLIQTAPRHRQATTQAPHLAIVRTAGLYFEDWLSEGWQKRGLTRNSVRDPNGALSNLPPPHRAPRRFAAARPQPRDAGGEGLRASLGHGRERRPTQADTLWIGPTYNRHWGARGEGFRPRSFASLRPEARLVAGAPLRAPFGGESPPPWPPFIGAPIPPPPSGRSRYLRPMNSSLRFRPPLRGFYGAKPNAQHLCTRQPKNSHDLELSALRATSSSS
jgi:hypothetical protein